MYYWFWGELSLSRHQWLVQHLLQRSCFPAPCVHWSAAALSSCRNMLSCICRKSTQPKVSASQILSLCCRVQNSHFVISAQSVGSRHTSQILTQSEIRGDRNCFIKWRHPQLCAWSLFMCLFRVNTGGELTSQNITIRQQSVRCVSAHMALCSNPG